MADIRRVEAPSPTRSEVKASTPDGRLPYILARRALRESRADQTSHKKKVHDALWAFSRTIRYEDVPLEPPLPASLENHLRRIEPYFSDDGTAGRGLNLDGGVAFLELAEDFDITCGRDLQPDHDLLAPATERQG